ncbi:MAG: hypothetical protein IPG89_13100 [Bacteroidetes bacterium]|nr:hypothetical protein [Bacteroidota bacterium]
MKLRKESKEVDLYVDNKRLTKKEKDELVEFIKQVKLNEKHKEKKHKKAA